MDSTWSQESQGSQMLLLPLLMLTGQGQRGQEHKEGDKDPPQEKKGGARQGDEADRPLKEEGWGAVRPVTKKGLIQTGGF